MSEQATPSAPPGPGSLSQREIWTIFSGLMLSMLLAALDQTIVSTALPTIVSDLGGADHLSWVVTAYMLAVTATTPLWGKLGDLLGRRRLYLTTVVIFLVGSALCGTASSMGQLIGYRAVQGVGAGGLIVLSQAIIGDVVSPRERGRYQGLFGAVFGVASVAGPLLGGFFVDNLSWHWAFYINLPVGAAALVVVTLVLPRTPSREGRVSIDYWGIMLLAAAATAVVLVTSFGSVWGWTSPGVIAVSAAGLACVAIFVGVERRVPEPVLPPRLFANRAFSVASAVGFVVGFAMFGAITFVPLFLQAVQGASATASGLRMIPMMAGLLLTSVLSGQLISRTGRYRHFPILGTGVFTVGMFLLSRMDLGTAPVVTSLYLLVLGIGLGMVMQVLVLVVQNAVEYRDLGTATSGVTFFRTIGGSVGVAVFGTVFNLRLDHLLTAAPPPTATGACSPAALETSSLAVRDCPAEVQAWFVTGFTDALSGVFLSAVPVGLLAFGLSWLLPEIPLRTAISTPEPGESFGMAGERSSLEELRLQLWRNLDRDDRLRLWEHVVADAQSTLTRGQAWMLARVAAEGSRTTATMAEVSQTPLEVVELTARELQQRGLVSLSDGLARITPSGKQQGERLREAAHQWLNGFLADVPGTDEDEVQALLDEVVRRLHEEPPPEPARG